MQCGYELSILAAEMSEKLSGNVQPGMSYLAAMAFLAQFQLYHILLPIAIEEKGADDPLTVFLVTKIREHRL